LQNQQQYGILESIAMAIAMAIFVAYFYGDGSFIDCLFILHDKT